MYMRSSIRPLKKIKNILVKNLMSILAALIVPASVFAQVNFSYTPEKPKPGDEVRFTYTPSGDLAGIIQVPEAYIVKKFIADKPYSEFHVLMDLDDKVVSSFKVEGIPTKFIIGKAGNIKFKEVGFDGEDNLIKKLPAMIELAN
ncbi:MAG: hypothetical protein BGN92_01245 [Sphingobacteriales bacterium 41-5]|nr:MAG: hypothetical protein ABS67_01955 [Niabella sp. SCN 42-15]OJU23185.1 MAG: hypothetical protein BGN92_01245 [Sphingobacteriales bacterium 41-5]